MFNRLALKGPIEMWEGPKVAEYQAQTWRTERERFVELNGGRLRVLRFTKELMKKAMESLFLDHRIILSDSIDSSIGNLKMKWSQ